MRISVCMATYNGAKYIGSQIDSILPQLRSNDELIISDDGSTDETIKIINSYVDERIKLFFNSEGKKYNKPHINVAHNFENALIHSSGDIIFLSDQDDIWVQDRISRTLPYFDSYDLVVSDCFLIKNGEVDYNSSLYKGRSPIMPLYKKIEGLRYQGCCMAFNREILYKALPFPDLIPLHDGWIGLIAEYTGKVKFLEERLFYYRFHDSNTSRGNNANSFFYKVIYRIRLFFLLLIRLIKLKLLKIKSN